MLQSIRPPVANFDSATAMLRATARFLHGKAFPGLGVVPSAMLPLPLLINRLPRKLREQVYIWSGWSEAVRAGQLSSIRMSELAKWVTRQYPQRRYQAIAVGSSNGALVNLCAAMGMPWLPQTLFLPVRRHGVDPDEPKQDMAWGQRHGRDLLKHNPEIQLHHMHDANQDRLMIQHMTYFRVKWRRLAAAYERFITENLEPGGTILLIECNLQWPTTQIDDRHYFQHGALGGLSIDEFFHGSERAAEYLRRYRPDRDSDRWHPPEPDAERPEAEWGFEPALRDEVEALAQRKGYHVRRVLFDHPEDFSPLVADLYQWWYRQRGIGARRLIGESFLLTEPYWTLRTGATPYWMFFNKEPSAERLRKFLDERELFDEIYLMLFCHGVESAGLTPAHEWQAIADKARKVGKLLGVDPDRYPLDFATYLKYHIAARNIPARYPMPGMLTLRQLDAFLGDNSGNYLVQWIDGGVREAVM